MPMFRAPTSAGVAVFWGLSRVHVVSPSVASQRIRMENKNKTVNALVKEQQEGKVVCLGLEEGEADWLAGVRSTLNY